jgi:hypothetical protein
VIALGLASWVLALATTEPERAHVEVSARGCGRLDAHEVARLLHIELLAVTEAIRSGPPLQVELACTVPTMAIAVADPLTGKRLSREVPMPADEPGRDRVVALAIAQLFAASWLELLMPPPPPPEQAAPTGPPEPEPEPEAVEAARELAYGRVRVRPRSLAFALAPVVRGRSLQRDALLTGGGELDLRAWFGNAAVVVRTGVEAGAARRKHGDVRALAILLGIGAAGRVALSRRWQLGGAAIASGGVARLRGTPSQAGVPSDSVTALTGQLALGAGPRLRLPPVAIELDLELGGMLRAPEGLVSGERSVSLGGLWAGAALRVAIERALPGGGRGRARHRRSPG